MITKDRGPFRILLEGNDDPQNRNQYFQVDYFDPSTSDYVKHEIIFVRDSRIAYNRAGRRYGRNLLNVTNLETGRLVVGSRS